MPQKSLTGQKMAYLRNCTYAVGKGSLSLLPRTRMTCMEHMGSISYDRLHCRNLLTLLDKGIAV